MWFKGLLFFFYTGLLVAPFIAAYSGQDERAFHKQAQLPYTNQTRIYKISTVVVEQPEATGSPERTQGTKNGHLKPAESSVILVTSDAEVASASEQYVQETSTVVRDGPRTTAAESNIASESETTSARAKDPEQSSIVLRSTGINSEAELRTTSTQSQEKIPEVTSSTSSRDPVSTTVSRSSFSRRTSSSLQSLIQASSTAVSSYVESTSEQLASLTATISESTLSFLPPLRNSTSSLSTTHSFYTETLTSILASSTTAIHVDSSKVLSQSENADDQPTPITASSIMESSAESVSSEAALSPSPTASAEVESLTSILEQSSSSIVNEPGVEPTSAISPTSKSTVESPATITGSPSTTIEQVPLPSSTSNGNAEEPSQSSNSPSPTETQPETDATEYSTSIPGAFIPSVVQSILSSIQSNVNSIIDVPEPSTTDIDSSTGTITSIPTSETLSTGIELPLVTTSPSVPNNTEVELPDQLSSIFSEIGDTVTSIGNDLSAVLSDLFSTQTEPLGPPIPTPTSEVNSALSSLTSDLPLPTLPPLPQSSGLTLSDDIPAPTSVPNSSETDMSFTQPSETDVIPNPTALPGNSTSTSGIAQATSSLGDTTNSPTTSTSDRATKVLPTTSIPSASNGASEVLPASSSDASNLSTSQSKQIPSSETRSNINTTPETELSSATGTTDGIAPTFTGGISRSSNGSAITTVSESITLTIRPTGTGVDSKTSPVSPSGSLETSGTESNRTSLATNSRATGSDSNTSATTPRSASRTNTTALASETSSVLSDSKIVSSAYTGFTTTMPTSFVQSTTVQTAPSSTTGVGAGGPVEEAKPAPLTKSQTAGIAIGGTTCLLIALIAALIIVRRYHANAPKRNSGASVYPEVAYLYDPPVGGSGGDAESGGSPPLMSGGAAGYGNVPNNSPRISQVSLNPYRDAVVPSPAPSPRLSGYGGPVGDARGDYATLTVNPYAYNPAAADYPALSPYRDTVPDLPPVLPPVSERASDPFEHDLLLTMDIRSETPDSITFLAAPPPSVRDHSPSPDNGSRTSLLTASNATHGHYTPEGRFSPEQPSLTASGSSKNQSNLGPISPLTPPPRTMSPPPIHKGWDEIKFDIANSSSTESLIPAPLTPYSLPAKNKSQSSLQGLGIQRRQRSRGGARQMPLSGIGLPLTVKKKPSKSSVGISPAKKQDDVVFDVPSMYGSPGPTIHDFYSADPNVQKKRDETRFADASLIGRRLF